MASVHIACSTQAADSRFEGAVSRSATMQERCSSTAKLSIGRTMVFGVSRTMQKVDARVMALFIPFSLRPIISLSACSPLISGFLN
jgi:hypothetical protein